MAKLDLKFKASKNNDPFLPPFESGLFLNKLSSTHNLIFNKFPLYEGHLLIITRAFELQSLDVTKEDL